MEIRTMQTDAELITAGNAKAHTTNDIKPLRASVHFAINVELVLSAKF
jgi:hypothetical protein